MFGDVSTHGMIMQEFVIPSSCRISQSPLLPADLKPYYKLQLSMVVCLFSPKMIFSITSCGYHYPVVSWKLRQDTSQLLVRKASVQMAELVKFTTSRPVEVSLHWILTLDMSNGGCKQILVIADHIIRYVQTVPWWNQTAQTTAKALYDNIFRFYSVPEKLHSDKGRNVESKFI